MARNVPGMLALSPTFLGLVWLLECRDSIGHLICRKDFCDDHARPLIARAEARGIETYWHGNSPPQRQMG
jgi:hypothetical protein